jgi:hypothetical protein
VIGRFVDIVDPLCLKVIVCFVDIVDPLCLKAPLNREGQQYQQNKQSPLNREGQQYQQNKQSPLNREGEQYIQFYLFRASSKWVSLNNDIVCRKNQEDEHRYVHNPLTTSTFSVAQFLHPVT